MKDLQQEKVVRHTILKYKMISPGDLIIAGVSGGPDSLVMLHLLKGLQKEFNFKLHVGHVDHSLRGEEAEEEARWVKETAENWGISCTVTKVNVPQYVQETGVSVEEAGHILRKRFFLELLAEVGAQKIALAHQADDQAETVLMHFLVGAGMQGLQGLKPVNYPFIRPLIFMRREAIEAYCRAHSLEPRQDSSNKNVVFLRNKIRHQVIPWLAEKTNPNLVETLNRTAYILQGDEDFLQSETKRLAQKYVQLKNNMLRLSINDWAVIPQGMQRRLIRLVYMKIGGKQGLDFLHVERVQNLIKEGQVGKYLQLPGKITVEKGYGELYYSQGENNKLRSSNSIGKNIMEKIRERPLKIPGETFIPETGQRIIADIVDVVGMASGLGDRDKMKVYFPWEEPFPLFYVRSRRAGDRISPSGLQGTKKLKDYFIDKKLPRKERDNILLVASGQDIVWIPGLVLTENSREKSLSGKYLALSIINPSPSQE
jgi:tRNA(Ile)-lysidine synthase